MVKWKETRNIIGKTAKEAEERFKKMAKDIGMKAVNIKSNKLNLRSGGKKVYKVSGTWKEKLKGKK